MPNYMSMEQDFMALIRIEIATGYELSVAGKIIAEEVTSTIEGLMARLCFCR
jgi:hypothetical protein